VKRPLDAIAQLVWNGLDAQSDRVQINLDINEMNGLQTIRVRDFGVGIPYAEVETLFGNLGDSWKRIAGRVNGRSLHGKSGKGRFKAFGLGALVEWKTTYRDNGNAYSYSISGSFAALDDFESSNPVPAVAATGTEVIISNLFRNYRSLVDDDAHLEIARLFAAYLSQYPEVSIDYNGIRVDPKSVQSHQGNYPLDDVELEDGTKVPVAVSVIEWTVPTKRIIHLCDASGVALHDVEAGQQIRAPGFQFTAYVKCDHFRELDKGNNLILDDLHPDVNAIIKPAKLKIKEHFRRRMAEEQGQIVERWKKEQIYPYDDKPHLDPIEEAERQVFDILAVNVESYLPKFEDADTKSRKFTFFLLAQALRENPDSVQEIITSLSGLKKEEQDELAELIRETSFPAIISSARLVKDRLNFLVGLHSLLFDEESKKVLLERDQLHRILEKEAWIFAEDFALAGSEVWLEEVLQKHIGILGEREDNADPVTLPDGKRGRVDLMLSKVLQPRSGEYDYLIVELKRPSKKIDSDIITKIKKYAMAVAGDERFHGIPARWTFIVVGNDLDEFARSDAQEQDDRPRGQIFNLSKPKITGWVKEWGEVINDARARLNFINSQLSYRATRESSQSYLKKAHAKFIPPQESGASEAETGENMSSSEPTEFEQ
jgi:hypothetical protein